MNAVNNKAHGIGLVTELDGNGGTLKWDGIFHEGLLLQRNEPRPPTPSTIHAETLHLVESVPVGIGYPELLVNCSAMYPLETEFWCSSFDISRGTPRGVCMMHSRTYTLSHSQTLTFTL